MQGSLNLLGGLLLYLVLLKTFVSLSVGAVGLLFQLFLKEHHSCRWLKDVFVLDLLIGMYRPQIVDIFTQLGDEVVLALELHLEDPYLVDECLVP